MVVTTHSLGTWSKLLSLVPSLTTAAAYPTIEVRSETRSGLAYLVAALLLFSKRWWFGLRRGSSDTDLL